MSSRASATRSSKRSGSTCTAPEPTAGPPAVRSAGGDGGAGRRAARGPRRGPAGRRRPARPGPCASTPAPARARPGSSPAASPTGRRPATSTPATSSPSPSPARPRASCGPACGSLGLRDDVAAGTFHAIAYAQLRARWADRGAEVPRLMDRKLRLRRRPPRPAAGRRPRTSSARSSGPRPASSRPSDYLAARPGPAPPAAARRRDAPPARPLRRGQDRVAGWSTSTTCSGSRCGSWSGTPPAAAAQRWRFRHLFVDEFQDVNPLQYRLLRAWLGDGDDLFVVGDPHQAIYGWNGADARYLDRFEEAFPAERFPGVAVLHLRDNYRSTPQVLAVAAAVLADQPPRRPPPRRAAADGRAPTPTRPPRPEPSPATSVSTTAPDGRGRPRPCWCAPTPRPR